MINLFLIKNKLKNKTNIQNNNNEIIAKITSININLSLNEFMKK